MTYLKRQTEQKILKLKDSFPAVLVTGPRQSGKTTLLRKLFANDAVFVSLEELDTRARALDDPRGFLNSDKPMILDEIQYAPELLPYIKRKIDDDRRPGRWFLTGSQQFALMKNVSESLAGRVAVINLLPFSQAELGQRFYPEYQDWFKWIFANSAKPGKLDILGNVILQGGYPELQLNKKIDRKVWFNSYINTYLERDIKSIYDIGNLQIFYKLLVLLAARTGQILNMNSLAGELGVSLPTVKRWVSILEACYIIFLLQPYYSNIGKRLVKSPKVYFYDTGLAAHLTGNTTIDVLLKGPMSSALFETFVVSEFMKNFYNHAQRPDIYFINNKNLWEIDLLVRVGQHYVPIEIKMTETIQAKHMVNFAKARKLVKDISEKNYMICLRNGISSHNTLISSWTGL